MPCDSASKSSVLFRSPDLNIVLFDIPLSLEEAQVLSGETPPRRIISTAPLSQPFATPEPGSGNKSGGAHHAAATASPAAQVADLMTGAAVQSAFHYLTTTYNGPYCLPRIVSASDRAHRTEPDVETEEDPYIPTGAQYLDGLVEKTRSDFREKCPIFDLIVVDPPWPNRSARRRTSSYRTATDLADMDSLLSPIPISSHLSQGGLVAIWVTNKAAVLKYVTQPQGLLSAWNLELVTEWTWVKITSMGETIIDIDSHFRKPWEKVLICRHRGSKLHNGLKPRTIFAVPDIHSRKPHLRSLFEGLFLKDYKGLEVFARQLTAGWWSWGNEVLKFQQRDCWEDMTNETAEPSSVSNPSGRLSFVPTDSE